MSSQLMKPGVRALYHTRVLSALSQITGTATRASTRRFANEADSDDTASMSNFPYPPEAWEQEVEAFVHRLEVPIGSLSHYETAMTHKSVAGVTAIPLWQTNGRQALLGRHLLSSYAAQHLVVNHPRLLPKSLTGALDTLSSTPHLHGKASALGVPRVYRWASAAEPIPGDSADLLDQVKEKTPQQELSALATGFRALVGAVYLDQGDEAARAFVHQHLLATPVETLVTSPAQRPKVALKEMLRREGKGRPVYKLLRESGRYSHLPVFIAGVYANGELLGEGAGSSIKKAQNAAATNVLAQYYGEVGNASMPEPFATSASA
eukprot:TRINITY_DN6112_c0_g2_i1.p1 TRINITY_DN6112_c0_g2~~TRINITY_DN6112_c0_g2_i1.p1  ORF type:complete len:321 (+),score=60.83 TRINITY_DN6112_c0_g2_i1:229-1191(+)